MKRHKLRITDVFIALYFIFGALNKGYCQEPNTSSTYIAPPPATKLSRVGNTIVPYSQYMQKQVEEHRRLFNKTQNYTSSATQQQKEDDKRPLLIYLPAFSKAGASFISDKEVNEQDKSIFSTKKSFPWKGLPTAKNPIRPQIKQETSNLHTFNQEEYGSSIRNNNLQNVVQNDKLSPSATYSTNSNRKPLPYKQSTFRSKSDNSFTPKNDAYHKMPTYLSFPTRHSSAENSLITRPSSMFQAARGSSNRHSPNLAQYSRIVPAPYNTLSSTPSEDNIVNSIFAQSQVRHAPPSPLFNGPPPMAGSPFDLLSSLNPQAALALGLGGGQNAMGGSQLLNPLSMLGQGGSTIEQISKIAKNLLSMGSGNQELLSAVTKAIGGGAVDAGSKLTSTAVISPESAVLLKTALAKEETMANGSLRNFSGATNASTNASATGPETLFSNGENMMTKEEALGGPITHNSSIKILSSLPQEQRSLLEAAIKNGELDAATLAPTLSTLLEHQSKTGVIRSENKLMEWIQQNRPRTAEKELNSVRVLAADKLPYYGKYCGSFVELPASSKQLNVAGALWAVDDRRLIVSKFNFQPGAGSENITFWAGPVNHTGTALDAIPNDYIDIFPVDIQAFMVHQVEKVLAKVRSPTVPLARDAPGGNKTAEQEEQEGEGSGENRLASNHLRMKRNLYDDLYANNNQKKVILPIHFSVPPANQDHLTHTADTDQSSMRTTAPNLLDNLQSTTTNAMFSSPASSSQVSSTPSATLQTITSGTLANVFPIFSAPTTSPFPPLFTPFGGNVISNNAANARSSQMKSLQWYAGFQPLLLTLPEDKWMKTLHWVSLFDHNKRQAVASVLIPNGVAFTIPSIVQLRSLSPNGAYQVKSGSIKVLDTKTIEIDEFSLTTNGIPAWFMVGKEIMPNANGHIVPIYNKATKTFDCDSLKNYKNETITLRLPGTMDIKDVFWFSVFSIPRSVSLAHMYLPYNDMHLPPDLLGASTPECVWKPKQ